EAVVARAMGCGLQVSTHAIGDRGNRTVLDAYEAALAATGGGPARHRVEHAQIGALWDVPRFAELGVIAAMPPAPAERDVATADGPGRHPVEHAQIVALEDVPRFAELRVIASMQPTHATSDMPWAEDRVGAERIRGAYAWQRFREAGVRLALGSDFPVEQVNPLLGFYAAVTRQDAEGEPPDGWMPDQRLTREQALRGFTLDAAYAGFMEDAVGSLTPGKWADFVILSQDLMTVPG